MRMSETEKVTHSLHQQETPWLDPGRLADAYGGCFGFSFHVRRRRTADGYTRLEGRINAPVAVSDEGATIFTVYLTDDERRSLAKALLEGIETPN